MTSAQEPSQPPTPEPGQTSLFDQIERTRESFMRLIQAHIELLKAEFNDIIGELKVLATQAGLALGIALMTAVLLWVGGFLFLGEWLFGSIGWGLAHGLLTGIGVIVALALGIVGAKARYAVFSFLVALVIVIAVALLCGINVAYNAVETVVPNLAGRSAPPAWLPCLAVCSLEPSCSVFFSPLWAGCAGRSAA